MNTSNEVKPRYISLSVFSELRCGRLIRAPIVFTFISDSVAMFPEVFCLLYCAHVFQFNLEFIFLVWLRSPPSLGAGQARVTPGMAQPAGGRPGALWEGREVPYITPVSTVGSDSDSRWRMYGRFVCLYVICRMFRSRCIIEFSSLPELDF